VARRAERRIDNSGVEYQKKADYEPKEGEALSDDFRHLLNLVRALRLAQKGNLAAGKRPDMADTKRLEAAVDHFISVMTHRGNIEDAP